IGIKGEADDRLEVRETLWGPVIGRGPDGRARALRWVAHDVDGVDLGLVHMEGVHTLAEALGVAQGSGIPAQSCVIADTTGAIGWTIAGRIPRRVGFDGRLPVSWADGSRGWRGWLAPADYPRIVDPPSGRIVSANNRLVGEDALRILGEQAYDQGARARQISDALLAMESATPQEMLNVQLDDRALFLARWRRLALDLLTPESSGAAPRRREFRDLLEHTWAGRASTDSVAYRLVKVFRAQAAELAFAPLLEPLREIDSRPPATPGRAMEGALWQLVTRRPAHLLDPHYASWDALLLDAIDRTAAQLTEGGRPLDRRTWGEANTLAMRHPVSPAMPWLGLLLDMDAQPLPGDTHMPRVQAPGFGASERLVVSPGHETEGLFHMPGGQSGHPLSPAYRAGHDDWVEGRATPLLPGPAVSTLHLVPAKP
ncbi:MAG: penicillin acylase family protein, partial [Chromatiaceae bacterium]